MKKIFSFGFLFIILSFHYSFADVVYDNLSANGMAVDNCVSYPDCCGNCGADYFCKMKGHSGFTGFSTGYGGPAYRLKAGDSCPFNYCVIFTGITCAGSPSDDCSSQRAAAEQECGGADKYIIDSSCKYACNSACSVSSDQSGNPTPLSSCLSQCSQLGSSCGSSNGYSIYDGQNCKGSCNPSSDCAQKYEQKSIECKQHIAQWDNSTCTGVCEECDQQYLSKKQECDNPFPVHSTYNGISDVDRCQYTCECTDSIKKANEDCPYGAEFASDCSYKCLSCDQLADKCVEQNGSKDNVSVYNCESLNGVPTDYICEPKGTDCKSFYSGCERSCATQECAGVKEERCVEALGIISYKKCECNGCAINGTPDKETCSNYTANCAAACSAPGCGGIDLKECSEGSSGIVNKTCDCKTCGSKDLNGFPPSNGSGTSGSGVGGTGSSGGGTGVPSDPPSNSSDVTGWLSSIKSNTDDLVRQGSDQTGWLSSIKSDTARSADYLKTIAGKNFNPSVDVTVDNSAVVGAVNNVGNTLSGIKSGLSDVGISTQTDPSLNSLGGGGEVTGTGYGSAPVDGDLPSSDSLKSSFGTLTPSSGGYRDTVKGVLPGMTVEASDSVCGIVLHLPVPTFSGLQWNDYTADFCPYQAILAQIGSVLVFLVALYELYRLS